MLTTLADIADLVAALGVIGSLLFLAFELRVQNRETGLANWRHLLETLTKFKGVTNDPYMDTDNLMLDHLNSPGARAWWAESKPKGRFMPQTVANIEAMQEPDRVPKGPHL